MIYLLFLMASLIAYFFVIFLMTFIDAYFSGPNYHLLNGYVGISKVILYVILHIGLIFLFRFHKNKNKLILSLIVLISISMTMILLNTR